jgi:SAM-dependent methyltransferase
VQLAWFRLSDALALVGVIFANVRRGKVTTTMVQPSDTNEYALGSAEAEQERLIRQAAWLAVHTERFFSRAGIGTGQRVLDLGSGVGDVALIAGRLVGPTGEVIGVERNALALARAAARMRDLGLRHVRFTQTDAADLPAEKPFDAAVGRYILMFLRDPVSVLRDVSRIVRPGGVVAFQEPCWKSFLEACEDLPLWRAGAALMVETFHRTGTNTQMGPDLSATFVSAGLPKPEALTDTLVGAERWMPDVLQSLAPQTQALNLSLAAVGDLATLYPRLLEEVASRNVPAPLPAMVGAWVRKPAL